MRDIFSVNLIIDFVIPVCISKTLNNYRLSTCIFLHFKSVHSSVRLFSTLSLKICPHQFDLPNDFKPLANHIPLKLTRLLHWINGNHYSCISFEHIIKGRLILKTNSDHFLGLFKKKDIFYFFVNGRLHIIIKYRQC